VGGAATSLGLSTPMVAHVVGALLGLDASFALEVAVVLASVALFATSVFLGLRRGIKRLSDLNVVLAMLLMLLVLSAGPTLFILEMGTSSFGYMLQNFIRMATWTDAVGQSGFVQSWTVFYWAWWLAYGPFVGVFVARISRGRTIREVILGMVVFGSLGSAFFFGIFGNYALHLQLQGIVPVAEIVARDGGSGGAAAIAAVLSALPAPKLVLALFALVSIVFTATTYDSAAYALASVATRQLPPGEDPDRWHRVFWAVALGILPLALLFIGGLRVVLSATLIVSLPLLGVFVLLAVSLVKALRRGAGEPPTTRPTD